MIRVGHFLRGISRRCKTSHPRWRDRRKYSRSLSRAVRCNISDSIQTSRTGRDRNRQLCRRTCETKQRVDLCRLHQSARTTTTHRGRKLGISGATSSYHDTENQTRALDQTTHGDGRCCSHEGPRRRRKHDGSMRFDWRGDRHRHNFSHRIKQ